MNWPFGDPEEEQERNVLGRAGWGRRECVFIVGVLLKLHTCSLGLCLFD